MGDPRLILLEGHPPGPNLRLSTYERAAHNTTWRRAARLTALDLINRYRFPTLQRATVTLVYRDKAGVRHDLDNLVAAAKPVLDGIVDAGVLAEDDTEHLVDLRCRLERAESRSLLVIVEPA